MKVFISWSGERSQAVAHALRDWLPLVLHYVDPWLSEADISAGERWADAVAKELEASNFGIICVTRENVGSHWVLFEAGALAKSLEGSRVIPLLFDLDFKNITGPLAQFQAKKVEKTGLSEVINSINSSGEHSVPNVRAKQLFDALWPEFEKAIESIPSSPATTKHMRPQNEILEELVASVRTLDSRFREMPDDATRDNRNKRPRLNSKMYEELAYRIDSKLEKATGLLVAVSALRDEAPWLYELGLEAYKAAQYGATQQRDEAYYRLSQTLEVIENSYYSRELGIDPTAVRMARRYLQRYFHTNLRNDQIASAELGESNEGP